LLVLIAIATASALLLLLIVKLDPLRASRDAFRWVVHTLPCMFVCMMAFACSVWTASLVTESSEASGWCRFFCRSVAWRSCLSFACVMT